jgi:hypothetical protein
LRKRNIERGTAYDGGAPDDNCPYASTSAHYSMPVAMGLDYSLLSSGYDADNAIAPQTLLSHGKPNYSLG